MRQGGITLQITLFLLVPNLPCQLAKSSTTPLCITQKTPNKTNTILQSSWAIGQWRSRWFIVSPTGQSMTTTRHFRRLSIARIFLKAAVQRKKATLVGTLGFHKLFQGKTGLKGVKYNWLGYIIYEDTFLVNLRCGYSWFLIFVGSVLTWKSLVYLVVSGHTFLSILV